MKIQQLQTIHNRILSSLDKGRVSHAFSELQAMAAAVSAPWEISSEILRLKESYGLLRRYALDGASDPGREAILNAICLDIRTMSERILRSSMVDDSPKQYFAAIRYERLQQASSLEEILKSYRELNNKLSIASLSFDPKSKQLAKNLRSEQAVVTKRLFNYVWTLFPLTKDASELLLGFLSDDNIRLESRMQILGAVFLGALEYYDERRLVVLARLYLDGVAGIELRALVCLVIAMWMQRDMLGGRELGNLLATIREQKGWNEDLKMVFLNLVRTRDTDRISRAMRDELIPQMMKLRPEILKKMSDKESFDDGDLTDFNPEWEELLEQSGIGDKLRELNDLQSEGSDVMLSTFAGLKSFPFFNDVANWFVPFYTEQPDVANVFDDSAEDLGEMISLAPMLCDNDKYSIAFSLESLPASNRRMMIEQFRAQSINVVELRNSLLNPEVVSRSGEANKFIHDLYRFFTLYRRKSDFNNPFRCPHQSCGSS